MRMLGVQAIHWVAFDGPTGAWSSGIWATRLIQRIQLRHKGSVLFGLQLSHPLDAQLGQDSLHCWGTMDVGGVNAALTDLFR